MSTPESKRNPSQSEQQSHKPGNPIQPKAQHSADKRKPLPFDDNGSPGDVVETTNVPKIDGIEG